MVVSEHQQGLSGLRVVCGERRYMSESIQLNWSALLQLVSLCSQFKEQKEKGEKVDLHDAAHKVGAAFGIEDIDKASVQKVRTVMESGFAQGVDEQSAKALASLFASSAKPVMTLVVGFAKGDKQPVDFIAGLNDICFGKVGEMQSLLQNALGVPDETANFLAGKLGPYLVSVYAFAAAYNIYQQAAHDAALARVHRLEIEQLTAESICQLKQQRAEMEQMVDGYLLNRLQPFAEGMAAMDQAVLDGDDNRFIEANAELWQLFGRDAQYKSGDEFEALMLSEETFRL